ncbi:hypothetical protein [Marinomonas fungiae]|uniref:Uncharacterized protein n=1 Tax=Marinomonas fungiae TaxID=1137284 RepID=A0A0K6IJN4_9GAMM|nr:hypothetical protein [Marinomonas fungiae]CUB03286.1 hypothetical protein Ga0061065_103136 [Marinomonas fungiae]
MEKRVFQNLRMTLLSNEEGFSLDLGVASGHADFSVLIKLTEEDYFVINTDEERAAFLQAALHHPFQLKETWLTESEQRTYFDTILHSTTETVEAFLTEKDHGRAHGSISNMVRITRGRDLSILRAGEWFEK